MLALLALALELVVVFAVELKVLRVSAVRLLVRAVDAALTVFAAQVACGGSCLRNNGTRTALVDLVVHPGVKVSY